MHGNPSTENWLTYQDKKDGRAKANPQRTTTEAPNRRTLQVTKAGYYEHQMGVRFRRYLRFGRYSLPAKRWKFFRHK